MAETQKQITNFYQCRRRSPAAKRLKFDTDLLSTPRTKTTESKATESKEMPPTLPVNVEPVRIPAYEKFAHLVSKGPACAPAYEKHADLISNNLNRLEMPVKHKILLDTFRATDQLISIMYNRLELITFKRLKDGVEKMTRKNFERKHLGQVKTVYPEAYIFDQRKFQNKFGSRTEEYTLIVSPNLETDLKPYGVSTPIKTPAKRKPDDNYRTPPSSPVKFCSSVRSPIKTPTKIDDDCVSDRKYMSGGRLLHRTEVFKKNLLSLLVEEHSKFLTSLSPPIQLTMSEIARLQRWHPKFPLNLLPEIAVSNLPEPPHVDKVYSAREILQQEKHKSFPIEMQNALERIAVNSSSQSASKTIESVKTCLLKGIPTGLLEKIRAKESAKNQQSLFINVENETKKQRLRRLPEMIKIIKMYFATENKSVLSANVVSKKLVESYKSLVSAGDIDVHLKLLLDTVPEWITETVIAEKGAFLRIDNKSYSASKAVSKIEQILNDLDK